MLKLWTSCACGSTFLCEQELWPWRRYAQCSTNNPSLAGRTPWLLIASSAIWRRDLGRRCFRLSVVACTSPCNCLIITYDELTPRNTLWIDFRLENPKMFMQGNAVGRVVWKILVIRFFRPQNVRICISSVRVVPCHDHHPRPQMFLTRKIIQSNFPELTQTPLSISHYMMVGDTFVVAKKFPIIPSVITLHLRHVSGMVSLD